MLRDRISRHLPLVTLVLIGGLALAQTIDSSGRVFPYAGYLEVDGAPANGVYDLEVGLFAQASGGASCDTLSYSGVSVFEGRFQILLDGVNDSCFSGAGLWLELAVAESGGTPVPLSPEGGGRIAMGAVPFAAGGASYTRFFAELVETLRVETGTLDTTGDITSTNGSIALTNGDVTATNGDITVTNGDLIATNGAVNAARANLGGRLEVTGGVISRGGPVPGGGADLGLYSQVPNNWVRFVSNNGPFKFFSDGSYGTNSILEIQSNGDTLVKGDLDVLGTTNLFIHCSQTGTRNGGGGGYTFTFTAGDCGGTLPDANYVGALKRMEICNGYNTVGVNDAPSPGISIYANGPCGPYSAEAVYVRLP